jgi:hypothetical protein
VAGADVPIRIATPGEGLPYTADATLLRTRFPGLAFTPERAAVERLHAWYLARKGSIDPARLARDK